MSAQLLPLEVVASSLGWSAAASLATAVGTLVLAVATFSSVRASRRSAELAERSLLLGLRPVLVPSRRDDPAETVLFGDSRRLEVGGGYAAVDADGEAVYMAIPLRNVGAGLAVLSGWHLSLGHVVSAGHASLEDFEPQQRDLYIPPGDTGFWQGAIRDASHRFAEAARSAPDPAQTLVVHLLYGDWEAGQRTITRFALLPPDEQGRRECSAGRHWRLDGAPNPREAGLA